MPTIVAYFYKNTYNYMVNHEKYHLLWYYNK
jgi:hypothetical protein